MITATAGHVDHGKTTLVRALTGEDTDRLPEEKRRGMSIDLGFAFMPVAESEPVAFVDVPGHERFVRNMTAGVQGIDLAVLVVAADDGPMPQTREHLEILEQLRVPDLVAVITKIDRVPAERVKAACDEVEALLEGRRYAGAEILPVSPVSGEGLEAVRRTLEERARAMVREARGERFRMHVDRAFVLDGLGLVATGTVVSGSVALGDEVSILPRGLPTRVRSLRANHVAAERAFPGQRCALALQGLKKGEVVRGDIVAHGGPVPRSRSIDVLLQRAHGSDEDFSRRAQVTVHLGTAILPAVLAPLSRDVALARLTFAREITARHADRLLIRDPGARRLRGGGSVVDALPPGRGGSKPQRIDALLRTADLRAEAAFEALLGAAEAAVNLHWFACNWHLSPDEMRRVEASQDIVHFAADGVPHAMLRAHWRALCDAVIAGVHRWHAAHPDLIGIRPAQLREWLGTAHSAGAVLASVEPLVREGRLKRHGPYVLAPAHQPILSPQDQALWGRAAGLLAGAAGRPPRVHELAETLQLEPGVIAAFLQRVSNAGLAYRVAHNRFFLPEAVARLVELARVLEAESGGAGFAAAQFRDRSGLGRNLTIQVLEFLDEVGYTWRAGDLRRVKIAAETEEQRTPVGRPDFKSGERRMTSLASSTPASSATS